MAREVHIPRGKWRQNEDSNWEILVVDEVTGLALDMTGYTLKCYVWPSQSENSGTPVFSVESVSITKFSEGGTNNGARIPVASTLTVSAGGQENIIEKLYFYELWRMDTGNKRILAYGNAPLAASPRRT